jgi:hypothetical protein
MDEANEQDSNAGSRDARERRRQRLRAALRDNLLKRKAQTRARMSAADTAANLTTTSSIEAPARQTPDDVASEDADPSVPSR